MLRPEVCSVWSTYHRFDLFPVMWKDGASIPKPAPGQVQHPELTPFRSLVEAPFKSSSLDGHQTLFLGVIWVPECPQTLLGHTRLWHPRDPELGCPPWQVSPSLGSAHGENAVAGVIHACGSHWFIMDLRSFPSYFCSRDRDGEIKAGWQPAGN